MLSAIVLAAGLSKRMGQPKMVLPWGETTVIGQVVKVIAQAGLEHIQVITGGARQQVEAALQDLPARPVFNPRFLEDEMVFSLQVGLSQLPPEIDAALVALGDQPQIEVDVVQAVVTTYRQTGAPLVVPSYQLRRGHPWIIARCLWPAVMVLQPGETLRDMLNAHADQIAYLTVDTPSILRDLDTPADYARDQPQ